MRKIIVIAFITALTLATIATIAVIVIPWVMAQGEGEVLPVAPETTFAWVVGAWLIYAIAGLVASVSKPTERFDPIKFAGSFLTAILTAFIAIGLGIEPGTVATQFGPSISMIATTILNTGPGLMLIYVFNKLYTLAMNLKAKIEAARALSTSGPPS